MVCIKARIRREGKGIFLELPEGTEGFPDESDGEVFHLRDGFYLLSFGIGGQEMEMQKAKPQGMSLSPSELSVIEKISRVRFEERTPSRIEGMLSQEEKKALEGLARKNAVYLFRKGKYSSEGVYSIAQGAYPKRGAGKKNGEGDEGLKKPSENAPANTLEILGGKEYAVVEPEDQQRFQDERVAELLKNREIFGIKGFDRKLYVCTGRFYEANLGQFREALSDSGGKSPQELAQALGFEPDACRVMLALMCEQGEAIEKKRGIYAIA